MPTRDRYPAGVPCWVDTSQPDPAAAAAFYGDLLEWKLEDQMPPDAAGRYFQATIDGARVAAVGSAMGDGPVTWMTYIAVDSADDAAERVRANGGTVISEPFDVFDAGRMAIFADPEGAVFSVWQAGQHTGAETVNAPGTWNFSDLNTRDLEGAQRFYGAVFGWEFDPIDFGGGPMAMARVPGYGDYLESIDPGVRERHASGGAPPGFTDAIGFFIPANGDSPANWNVTFSVADADASAARVKELGGQVLSEPVDVPWSRVTQIRDPQGATLTLSQFKPPDA
jgi:predicted enzyme related to lactoylglutathione lyase